MGVFFQLRDAQVLAKYGPLPTRVKVVDLFAGETELGGEVERCSFPASNLSQVCSSHLPEAKVNRRLPRHEARQRVGDAETKVKPLQPAVTRIRGGESENEGKFPWFLRIAQPAPHGIRGKVLSVRGLYAPPEGAAAINRLSSGLDGLFPTLKPAWLLSWFLPSVSTPIAC